MGNLRYSAVKYLLTVSYDGRNYCGYQKQKNGVSVQEKLSVLFTKLYVVMTFILSLTALTTVLLIKCIV